MAKLVITTGVITLFLVIFLAEVSSQSQVLLIDPNVRKLVVAEDGRQTLDCYITVNQQISPQSINWTGPQNAVFTTNTRTDNKFTYHNILTIDPFTENHVGDYTCTFSDQETKIQLFTVKEDKMEGEFIFGNKSATLQCTLSFSDQSLQATFVTWLKDNTSLSEIKDPERFQDEGNGTLIISKPTRADSGLYIARYNIVGTDFQSSHDCEVVYSAAPLVLDMDKSKNVIEGETLHLECWIKGYPPANVTWLREGISVVLDGSRVLTESYRGYDNARLVIKSTSVSDAGNYTCLATGKNGEESAKSIRVRVKDRLEWLWPVIGILGEAVALAIVIFACSKLRKDDEIDKPADEREGLLRQGSARNRDQEKHD